VILAFSQLSGDQFLSWGWRVPFWLSLVMVGIGLWIRLGILETPIFTRVLAEEQIARAPVIEVFRRQPKSIVLTALADGAGDAGLRLWRVHLWNQEGGRNGG
jgi:MFS family permease